MPMLSTSPLILALLMQVGPNPLAGGLPGDDLVRDRPPRAEAAASELNPTSAWLESCLDLVEEDPARAHTLAQIQSTDGERTADRVLGYHCLGLASTALGRWGDAQRAFQNAKNASPVGDLRIRARFGAMSGNAALAEGNPDLALMMFEWARDDAREAAAPTLEAIAAKGLARTLVSLGREEDALGALGEATRLLPEDGEGWLLKATLLRRLDRLAEAQVAIESAAQRVSGAAGVGPEIGLEAGVIAVLGGRDEAARQSWQSVIDLAPEHPAAATAKGYLAQLGPAGETAPAPAQESPPS